MSRARKWGVAFTLLLFAGIAGLCWWFLATYDLDTASKYAGAIQAVAAVFGLSGVVFAVMALTSSSGVAGSVQRNRAGAGGVVIASQNGHVYTSGHAPGPAEGSVEKGAPGGKTSP